MITCVIYVSHSGFSCIILKFTLRRTISQFFGHKPPLSSIARFLETSEISVDWRPRTGRDSPQFRHRHKNHHLGAHSLHAPPNLPSWLNCDELHIKIRYVTRDPAILGIFASPAPTTETSRSPGAFVMRDGGRAITHLNPDNAIAVTRGKDGIMAEEVRVKGV